MSTLSKLEELIVNEAKCFKQATLEIIPTQDESLNSWAKGYLEGLKEAISLLKMVKSCKN